MLPPLNIPANCKRLIVGLSGGVDSVVLLHWAKQQCPDFVTLSAIHINHQLSPNAGQWQQQVECLCASLNIPLNTVNVAVNPAGQGVEQAARQARYQAFEQLLQAGDVLAVGHHQNDQAETLLLRLMRGAGVQGLAAMPVERPLGQGLLWRPLLQCPKASILNYAKQQALQWVEDESNADTRFSRNYVRHQVLPVIAQHWPQAVKQITVAAGHAREAQHLLDEYAALDFASVGSRQERCGSSIDMAALRVLSWSRQKQLVRFWLKQEGELAPQSCHFEELEKLLQAQADAQPALLLGSYGFSRFQQRLYLLPASILQSVAPKPVSFKEHCVLSDGSELRVTGFTGELQVRYRQGGERAQPAGRAHSQVLKKLLQEYRLEPWLRHRIPLIYCNNSLIAVGDLWLQCNAASLCGLPEGAPLSVTWRFPQDAF